MLQSFDSPRWEIATGMTEEEVVANLHDVNKAKVKEISGPYDLGCLQRYPRAKLHNIIDARWVIIWKNDRGKCGRGMQVHCKRF